MFESKSYDTKKPGELETRQTDRRARFTSSANEVEPESTEAIKRREAVATFAAMCRRSGQWRFENADVMIPIITRLPGWRQSRVVLQILEEGHPAVYFGSDDEVNFAPAITIRRVNNNHYRAVIDNEDVELGADGDCFFYSIWYALETSVSAEARKQIYGGDFKGSKSEAALFFRRSISDYALANEDEIAPFLTYPHAAAGSGKKPDTRDVRTEAENAAQPAAGWFESVPFALTEIKRSLFHAGKSLSYALGWSWLTGQVWKAASQLLPVQPWELQLCFVYDAVINKREYLDAFLGLLSLLPYHLLSSENFVFAVTDAARQVYGSLVTGMDEVPFFFWTALAVAAITAQYGFFARDMELPQTRVGQTATEFLIQFRRIPQLYGLLESIHSATPNFQWGADVQAETDLADFASRVASNSPSTMLRNASAAYPTPGQCALNRTIRLPICKVPGNFTNTSSAGLNSSRTGAPEAIPRAKPGMVVFPTYRQPAPIRRKPASDKTRPSSEAPVGTKDEILRCVFHAGKSLSSTLGWSWLTGQGWKTFFQLLPVNAWEFQLWFLYQALVNERAYLDAFLGLAALIPYNALSSENVLFTIADAARQIYHPLLSGLDDLHPYAWAMTGALALAIHYGYFTEVEVDSPKTRIGRAASDITARSLWQLRRIPQIYGMLETINSAVPLCAVDENGQVKPFSKKLEKTLAARKACRVELSPELITSLSVHTNRTLSNAKPQPQTPEHTIHQQVCAAPINTTNQFRFNPIFSESSRSKTPIYPDKSLIRNPNFGPSVSAHLVVNASQTDLNTSDAQFIPPCFNPSDQNLPPPSRHFATSDAPEATPFIMLPIATATALIVVQDPAEMWRRRAVLAVVATVTISSIVA